MALVIRLRKLGARHQPHFRIAVTESATGRDSRSLEELGWYDPQKTGLNSKVNVERTLYWLDKGAQPSDTVRSILKQHNVFGTGKAPVADEPTPAEQPAPPAETPAAPAQAPTAPPQAEATAEPEAPVEEPKPEAPAEEPKPEAPAEESAPEPAAEQPQETTEPPTEKTE